MKEKIIQNRTIGNDLNYEFVYNYDKNYAHRLVNIGNRYYKYDSNGNIICEQEGAFEDSEEIVYKKVTEEAENVYSTDYGWGLFKEEIGGSSSVGETRYKRTYAWNEKNQLISSVDESYSTSYVYGQDGQRSNKYTANSETLYFNKMWTLHTDSGNSSYGGQYAKNIYLGETRIVTKLNSGNNPTYQEEYYKQYYYHSDHLGSASLISDYKGDEYQRIEYTPYGETWVEKTSNTGLEFLPYKFTAKEQDEETGLYYFGARYLDPKYSMWISTDPALSEYMAGSSVGCGGIYNHINLNLYHYAGNNPIKYIDPTGCDDLYYDEYGNYLKTEISDTTNVYLSNNGSDTLVGSQTDFDTMTAALYGEGTDNLDEMQAIGDVIMNRAEFMGTSAGTEITAAGQVNGYNASSRKAVADGQTSNENSKLNTARNAAITTILGTSRGKSNGAYYWDGADITYNSHRNWGIHYTDSSHDIYGTGDTTGGPYQNYNRDANNNPTTLRGTTNYILDSTAAYGGTIFWKKSDEYRRIMQERAFTR